MEHKQLYDLLSTLGLEVGYDHLDSNKNINPPFIVYRETVPDTFKADNKTYYRPYEFEIELVTIKKDLTLQKRIEKLLDDNNIPYDMLDETWDNEEKIYHNFYEI